MCVLLFSMDAAAKDLNALKAQVQGGQLDAASASLSKLKVGTTIYMKHFRKTKVLLL
jgi:hypothetical protein